MWRELLRDGHCPDEPMVVEVLPETCEMPNGAPAEMTVKQPVSAKPGPQRRLSTCSEFSSMTEALGIMMPPPMVDLPKGPIPNFYDDTS